MDGIVGPDQVIVGDSVRSELARLLQAKGLPATFSARLEIDKVDAGTFEQPSSGDAKEVGEGIAGSLFEGLRRWTR